MSLMNEKILYAEFNTQQDMSATGGLLIGFDFDDIFEDPENMLVYLIPRNADLTLPEDVFDKEHYFFVSGEWADALFSVNALDVDSHSVGDKLVSKREVFVFDIPKIINLRAGLTVHDFEGTWSSWPMHTFEERALLSPANTYPMFEEVFGFMTKPVGSWGLQAIVGRGGSNVRAIADRQIVRIPLSLHPVVGAPDTRLAYFWAYTNGGEKFTKEGRV